MPPKGTLAPYDPENYDESFAAEYGGYTFIEVAGGGGGRGGRGGPRFVGYTSTKTTYCSTDSKGCVAAAACQIMFRIGTACWVFHILYPLSQKVAFFPGYLFTDKGTCKSIPQTAYQSSSYCSTAPGCDQQTHT